MDLECYNFLLKKIYVCLSDVKESLRNKQNENEMATPYCCFSTVLERQRNKRNEKKWRLHIVILEK